VSGRVILAVTESQAAVLLAVEAGRDLPDVRRLWHVTDALARRGLIEHTSWTGTHSAAASRWRLTPCGIALVGVLQADAARRANARLALPAATQDEQGREET